MRNSIKVAKSVLIIGGGATGLEVAGYIREAHSVDNKKVGIC